jgi:hypothetical protein
VSSSSILASRGDVAAASTLLRVDLKALIGGISGVTGVLGVLSFSCGDC